MKLTVKQVKKVFKEKTHCGKCWGIKPRYNPFTKKVKIKLEEDESLVYNMKTGIGYREDLDFDGCTILNHFKFVIGKGKDGDLTILKIS